MLSREIKDFLNNLEDYVNASLTYFGSIVRTDFIPGKSDIDAAIFSDNPASTIEKLSNYLSVPRSDIIPFVIVAGGKSVHGNKIKYKYTTKNGSTQMLEFLVYNKKYQHQVMQENYKRFKLPFHISYLLSILKIIHFRLHIISGATYASFKRFLINDMLLGTGHTQFVLM